MRAHPIHLSVAVAVTGAFVPVAGAQPVIDSFETGTFHLEAQAKEYVTGSYSVSSPAHAIAPFREVGLISFTGVGLPAYADLDAWTVVDDVLHLTFGPDGGAAVLTYTPLSPVDLTAAGENDRIVMDFAALTVGGTVELRISDALNTYEVHELPTAGPHAFPFLQFSTIDFTQITRVEIFFSHPSASQYDLRDVRAVRHDSTPLTFDVPVETVFGPPYPTDPLVFAVTDMTPSDLQSLRLLRATTVETGAAVPLALTGMDSGGDTEAGTTGAVQTAWNLAGVPFQSAAFDLQVDVDALSGIQPQPFLPALPVVTTTPTGFVLAFDLQFLGDGGEVVRTSRRQMAFDARPGQALVFEEPLVHPPDAIRPARGDTPVGFRVTFTLVDVGGVDVAEALFEASFTGDCRVETTTGVPSGGGVGSTGADQALAAWPSVTRSGTALRLVRPAEAAGRIDLFDVGGRLLRSLEVPRGGTGSYWDGRDASGRLASAGVAFVRFTDGTRELGTRVLILR